MRSQESAVSLEYTVNNWKPRSSGLYLQPLYKGCNPLSGRSLPLDHPDYDAEVFMPPETNKRKIEKESSGYKKNIFDLNRKKIIIIISASKK